jgi:hypothetical protein
LSPLTTRRVTVEVFNPASTPEYSTHLSAFCQSHSQSYVTTDGQLDSQSWNKVPIWGLRSDFYYCQTIAGLLKWGAVSDKRTDLSFTIDPGLRQRSNFLVRLPWGTRGHIFLSNSRPFRDFPFRRLLRHAGLRWRYSTPPPHGSNFRAWPPFITVRELCRNHVLKGVCFCCLCMLVPETCLVPW